MPDVPDDGRYDDWVATTFQADPKAYSGVPSASASGSFFDDVIDGAKSLAERGADAVSDVVDRGRAVADEAVDAGRKAIEAGKKTVEGLIDRGKKTVEEIEQGVEDAVKKIAKRIADSKPATPPSTPPSGPPSTPTAPAKLTLKSETEVSSPSSRTRTKLGVGERVTLSVTPGPGTWTAPGAKLSAATGSKVTMTAPNRPGNVEVTVEVGGAKESIRFSVVAPSSVSQQLSSTEHYNLGVPNAGFRAVIFLGPDDVNFNAVTFTEDEVSCTATGSWVSKNGEGHSPNGSPLACTDQVVAGRGTKTGATDHCWTGYVPGLSLPDWTGTMVWPIPWKWQCNGGSGTIGTVRQNVTTDASGSTTIAKAGASFTAALS